MTERAAAIRLLPSGQHLSTKRKFRLRLSLNHYEHEIFQPRLETVLLARATIRQACYAGKCSAGRDGAQAQRGRSCKSSSAR